MAVPEEDIMVRTPNSSVDRAVIRAYREGMKLEDISSLFSVSYEYVIRTMYEHMCVTK